MKQRNSNRTFLSVAIGGLTVALVAHGGLCAERQAADAILQAAGIEGGLVVHIGCGDGKLTAGLRASDRFLVHGLDTDAKNVAAARKHIQSLGLYGPVSVQQWSGQRLPYVDNLVNLIVVRRQLSVAKTELLRVLCPGGVAVFTADHGQLTKDKFVKPWPKEIDEWTHYLHGADNNAVAQDSVVGPPRHMQWLAEPLFARNHDRLASISALVSHGGRLFYIVDQNAVPVVGMAPKWGLVARDAFNGIWLWERPIGAWANIERGFRSGPDQLPRLLVATGGRVYAPLGFDQPVSAMDAATGQTLKVYPETTGTEEIIVHEGVLLAVVGTPVAEQALAGSVRRGEKKKPAAAGERPAKSIVALRADSGEVLWRKSTPEIDALRSLTLAANGNRVFYADGNGTACVELATGRPLWRHEAPAPPPGPLGQSSGTLVVRDGVVLVALAGKGKRGLTLTALAADTGRQLWETPCGSGAWSPPDVLVAGGLVWTGSRFEAGCDLRTGESKQPLDVASRLWTAGHHHRCYREKATERFILTGYRGIELMDLAGDGHSRNNWVRGGCQYGILPCNGLIYAPTHVCGCYFEAMVRGFWALAPERESSGESPEARAGERLEPGPAFRQALDSRPSTLDPSDWPTYRGDAARSGGTAAEVPAALAPAWQTVIGGKLSAPVVAGGKVFVGSIDEHRVVALDAAQGRVLWSFTAGGRVDSPPTVWQDGVLFGCADGWVYCLRATDGQLRWRFLAATDERRTVALDQLESLWPVNGSVLIQDGLAYVAAGRSSYLDGGIRLYALEPATGRIVHESRLRNDHPPFHKTELTADLEALRRDEPDWPQTQNRFDARTYLDPDKSDGFSMDGATTDVLVGDGASVYLRQLRFDRSLARQPRGDRHLYSTTRLIDDAAAHRSHWLLGTGDTRPLGVAYEWHTRSLGGGHARCCAVPFGLMLTFDEQTAWGVSKNPGELFAVPLRPVGPDTQIDFRPPSPENILKLQWSVPLPVAARAMVRAGGTLWVAGLPKAGEKASAATRAAVDGPGLLAAFSAAAGESRSEFPLTSPPVWDGLAVAERSLYVSTIEGKLLCLRGATK